MEQNGLGGLVRTSEVHELDALSMEAGICVRQGSLGFERKARFRNPGLGNPKGFS